MAQTWWGGGGVLAIIWRERIEIANIFFPQQNDFSGVWWIQPKMDVHCSFLLCFVFSWAAQPIFQHHAILSNPKNQTWGRAGWGKYEKWKICESRRCLSQWNQRHFKASNRRGDSPSRAIWEQSVRIAEVLLLARQRQWYHCSCQQH